MDSVLTGVVVLVALALASVVVSNRHLEPLDVPALRRVGYYSGHAAPAVAWGGIVVSALLGAPFDLLAQPVSDLGVQAGPAASVFTVAMIATGIAATPFGVAVLVTGTVWERLAVVCLAAAMNGLNLIGLFPRGATLHVVGGLFFFCGLTLGLACFAYGTPDRRWARVSAVLAALHAGVWLAWGAYAGVLRPEVGLFFGPGSAIPQLAGALVLGSWTIWLSRARFRRT
jgi:hypothetical membrane protein